MQYNQLENKHIKANPRENRTNLTFMLFEKLQKIKKSAKIFEILLFFNSDPNISKTNSK
jgi:hypothetical protein